VAPASAVRGKPMVRRPTNRRTLLLGVALLIAAALALGAMLARVGPQPEPDASGAGLASELIDAPRFAQEAPAREVPVEVAAPLPDAPPARDGRKPRELRGVVLRSDGSPAAQIDVALFGGDSSQRVPLRKVKADKQGGFVFDEAPLGRSLVCSPPFTWIEAVQAAVVDGVNPPEPLTLRLPPSGTLIGLLVDRSGPAESSSQVIAQSVEHPERMSNASWTWGGHFSIANLPAGEWDLYATRGAAPWSPAALNRPANGAPGFASFSEAGETAAHLASISGASGCRSRPGSRASTSPPSRRTACSSTRVGARRAVRTRRCPSTACKPGAAAASAST
jgi:hypothetical protein